MNRRVEQRFQAYIPVKLTVLDPPEQPELDCLLVDISGAGMKLVADAELPQDQMISIEAGQYVVLAEVRHCSPRGSKFAIGVEKVHVMPAAILNREANKAARLQALVDNYHLRIKEGIEATLWGPDMIASMTPEPKHVPEAFPQAPAAPEVLVAGSAETAAEPPSPETEAPPAQPVAAPCIPAEVPEDSLDPIRAALETVETVPPPVRSRRTAKVVGAAVGAALLAVLLIAPVRGRMFSFARAAEAGKQIKPEAPENVREALPSSSATAGTPESGKPETEPIEEAVSNVAKSAAEAVSSVAPKPAPSVATPPARPVVAGGTLGKEHALFKFTGASWVSICADGQKLFERVLPAGDIREIMFSDKAVVRLGNSGAVELALNGKPVGSLGQPGQLRLLELTSTGLRPLPTGDPAGDCAKARVN